MNPEMIPWTIIVVIGGGFLLLAGASWICTRPEKRKSRLSSIRPGDKFRGEEVLHVDDDISQLAQYNGMAIPEDHTYHVIVVTRKPDGGRRETKVVV